MAKKVNYYGYVKVDGVFVDDIKAHLKYLRNSSLDSLRLSVQNVVIPNNVTDLALPLMIRPDAAFTYFFLDSKDVDSLVSVKLNGLTTVFKLAPDFWCESEIESVTVTNTDSQKFNVVVVQLFAEGVG